MTIPDIAGVPSTARRSFPWRPLVGAFGITGLMGVPLGIAWWLLAPKFHFVVRDGGLYGAENNPLDWFGRDGWFIICGVVVGVVAGLISYLRWRRHPFAVLAGVTLGGLLAAYLGMLIGQLLGPPDVPTDLHGIASGTVYAVPLNLLAPASLLAVAFAAVATVGVAVAVDGSPDDVS